MIKYPKKQSQKKMKNNNNKQAYNDIEGHVDDTSHM